MEIIIEPFHWQCHYDGKQRRWRSWRVYPGASLRRRHKRPKKTAPFDRNLNIYITVQCSLQCDKGPELWRLDVCLCVCACIYQAAAAGSHDDYIWSHRRLRFILRPLQASVSSDVQIFRDRTHHAGMYCLAFKNGMNNKNRWWSL